MATKIETPHTGGFIVSESNGSRSRTAITVLAGGVLEVGQLYVLDGAEKAIPYTDGATVAGIAWDKYDATLNDVEGAGVVRDAEVNEAELVVFAGATATQIKTAMTGLEALGIIARKGA